MASFTNDGELTIGTHLDNAAGLMLFLALARILDHIVHSVLDVIRNLIEGSWSGFATDVGTCTYDGLLKSETEFFAERFSCDAYAYTSIFCHEIGRQSCHIIKNNGERFLAEFNHVPSDICHISHITLKAHIAIYQADECLAVLALFDGIYFFYSLWVGCITTDAPNGVGRVEDDTSCLHDLYGFLYFVL